MINSNIKAWILPDGWKPVLYPAAAPHWDDVKQSPTQPVTSDLDQPVWANIANVGVERCW